MNIWVFILFTTLGALVWNTVLAGLGWWLSRQVSLSQLYDAVEKYNSYLTIGGLVLLGLCVIYILYNAFKGKKKDNKK